MKRVQKLLSTYTGISVLPTTYKIVPSILVSRLILHVEEVIGDCHYRFKHNRSTSDKIFYIHQTQKKKWEYNGIEHQLFIDLEKAYNSVRREVLYSILTEFGIPMKQVMLIKMCLT
jgi:hypothetical protein